MGGPITIEKSGPRTTPCHPDCRAVQCLAAKRALRREKVDALVDALDTALGYIANEIGEETHLLAELAALAKEIR